jgi:hypothetical protein
MSALRFGAYHSGDWPYAHPDGVGLALAGAPTDVHAFIDILHGVSCNPVATRRILAELQAGQTKLTTVRANLNFIEIGDDLARVGVTMSIIPPGEPGDPDIDAQALAIVLGAMPNLATHTEATQSEIAARAAHLRRSMTEIPHDFGKFA